MYILDQSKTTLINFDNFHELFMDNNMICARQYSLDKKINVVLGRYETEEEAKKEFDDLQESLLDENVGIHEVE